MPIKVGNTGIGEIYVGGTKIAQAYRGSTLIYSASVAPSFDGYVIRAEWNPQGASQVSAQGFKFNGSTVASTDIYKGFLITQGGSYQTLTSSEIEGACGEHDQFIMWGWGSEFWVANNASLSEFQWHCFTYFQPAGTWTMSIYKYTGDTMESTPIYTDDVSVDADVTITMTIT